jgi:hypothetical protein
MNDNPHDLFGVPIMEPIGQTQLGLFGQQAIQPAPTAAPEAPRKYWNPKPWHVETPADRLIAKKFSKCVSMPMF